MVSAKTATLTFRIEPGLKDGVRTDSVKLHRSIANKVSVIIRGYFGRVGVEVQAPEAQPTKAKRKPKNK